MKRRLSIVLASAFGLALAMAACGSFVGSDSSSPSPDLDGAPEASNASATDGASSPDAGLTVDAEACVLATSPTIVANVAAAPSKLATDGAHVFWIEGGSVMRASLADCQTTLIAQTKATALAVDSNWIVWGDPGYHAVSQGADASTLTAVTHIDPSFLLSGRGYWLGVPDNVASCATPCMSTSTALLVKSPTLLAANASTLFVFGIKPDAGTTLDLWKHPITSTSASDLEGPLAQNQDPLAITAAAAGVFWLSKTGQLSGVLADGTKPPNLPTVAGARALALDDSFVYVATASAIGSVPIASGAAPTPIVQGEAEITSLVVTADALVWATPTEIRRIKK